MTSRRMAAQIARRASTILAAAALAVTVSVAGTASVYAAPAEAPRCYNTGVATHDMAGGYIAPDLDAAIVVNACGGVEIAWDNDSGRHNALYGAVDRLPGGGFIAKADVADGGIFPNGANVIGIKPAERGTIQLITTNGKGEITGVYQLIKVR